MSRLYGIRSLAEARAYLAHEVLGARLREITRVVLDSEVEDVEELMGGETDRDKLLSCMTLFARAAGENDGYGDGEGGASQRLEDADDNAGPGRRASISNESDSNNDNVFAAVLEKYFDGKGDVVTEQALDEEVL
ncbi:uncharacterized protein B0I36DRAFT_330868 [Microdochium trichocladiopsis]|uniref:Uncharacterized protein n=1 Tax=Microdochium trichocladiopsis TaxID=1682393 RepID=A0A9P9BMR8_9PEZI|nr:uncharacterized protein B0I36DRAFT_330868 [Microdochium trichocladiopsis]KAH7026548.1 hypothetical protein B0I36DRAFT_330868 [Microdochium trichocladiopsis]